MNKKQKIILFTGISVIIILVAAWLLSGREIFTKTTVFVEKTDELFGFTYKEPVDTFILGLDYTAAASVAVVILSAILFFIFKNKKDH